MAHDPDREEANFFLRIFAMGLTPKPPALTPTTLDESVGFLGEHVLDHHDRPAPPFEPRDRLLADDRYWAAKRLNAISPNVLADAIQAGELNDLATNWLFQVLNLRRAELIAAGYDATTPCEVLSLRPASGDAPAELVLANLAIESKFVRGDEVEYQVSFIDLEAEPIAEPTTLGASGSIVSVPLSGLSEQPYVVVRVLALRAGKPLPRAFEAHLVPDGHTFRLLGVRH